MLFFNILLVACGSSARDPAGGPASGPSGPASGPSSPASGPSGPASGPTIAFVDVTVITMDRDAPTPHQTVIVRGDAISEIGPADRVAVPGDAMPIDGTGKFLAPGLYDMHVHLDHTRGMLALFVERGVTGVRNMAGSARTLALRDRVARGDVLGPTIWTAGPFVDGARPRWEGSMVVTTAVDAERAIAEHVAAGYDFVKVYNGLSREAYDALAAAANAHGMRLVGHVPVAVSLEHAMETQASIEHLTGYAEAIERRDSPVRARRGDSSSIRRWQYADPERVAQIAAATARTGVYSCPTLVTAAAYGELWRGRTPRADLEGVSPTWRARWDPKRSPWGRPKSNLRHAMEATGDRRLASQLALVRELVAAGAPLLAGTDTPNAYVVPGESLHHELALFVEAGLSPYAALRAATIDAADFLGDARGGRIRAGARADLILLDADPLADIRALDRIDGVVLRGRWLDAQALRVLRDSQVATYGAPPWLAAVALDDIAPGAHDIEYVVADNNAPIGAYVLARVGHDLVDRETLEDDTTTSHLAIGADHRVNALDVDVVRADGTFRVAHQRGPRDLPLVGALTPATGLAITAGLALEVDQHATFAVSTLDEDAPATLRRGALTVTRLVPPSTGQRAYKLRLAVDRTATVARIVIDGDGVPRFFKVSSTTRPLVRTWERR
jgi:imidazolonepropionase-like amidohydrolase